MPAVTRNTTPWINANLKSNRPVRPGWYEVQLTLSKDQRIRRRYWDGTKFSAPVRVGESDKEAACCKAIPCPHAPSKIRRRGLTAPAKK